MSTTEFVSEMSDAGESVPYRAICKSAIFALVLGVLSLGAFLTPILLILPALGIMAGLVARKQLRRYPEELTGRPVAWIGLIGSAAVLLGGTAMHTVIFVTEVPDGYRRITFNDLQPSEASRGLPVSPLAMELNGKKAFVKGYVYPDGQRTNIKRFVLVADLGTCCFGGQPKLTHMIEVTLRDPDRVAYSMHKLKLGGTLKVDTRLKPLSGLGGVYFQLDADYVR
jgi:hypothetical protein